MDFNFTDEQNMLRAAIREFVEAEIKPYRQQWDEDSYCPVELMPKLGAMGILGIFVPKQYGGVGLGHVERVIAMEEIARYCPSISMMVFTHQLAVGAILDFANEEQKMKYLPKMCTGEIVAGLAVTEPGGGSDVAGQKSKARLENGEWIINGRKCFITNSHITTHTIITAGTGVDAKGRNQFSALMIETGTPGFQPGRKEHKLGLRASATGELIMNNVHVPEDHLIGKEGKGQAIAMKEIGEIGRASMAAICVGILRGCVEDSVKFANERIVYGKPIAKLQAIQFHIAENRIDYEAAKLLTYRAAFLKDQGIPVTPEFGMAKHFGTEAASRAAKRTIELMGGYGVVEEYDAGRYLRDALTSISSGGTSEIQRIIVAGDTLKKFA